MSSLFSRPLRTSPRTALTATVAICSVGSLVVAANWLFGNDFAPSPTVSPTTVGEIAAPHFATTPAHPLAVSIADDGFAAVSSPTSETYPPTTTYRPVPPCAPPLNGVDCGNGCGGERGWGAAQPIDFQPYAQGEYVGHARSAHVGEYRIRVDDVLEFVFRLTREETSRPYLLNVGDEVRVESFTDPTLNRDLLIQPDGTITLRLIGQVKATRQTVVQLRETLEQAYVKYYKIPAITVTPLKVNTKLEDLRATVDARAGTGGQNRQARVTPEGTIALPAIGNVPVQGLTLGELKRELDERFAAEVEGIEVTPVLVTRAPRHAFVLGEVRNPGRLTLDGPTTVMQALSMAGGWNVGANTRQIVVFRRGDDWRLMATMLDLRGALYGKMPCPADEIWLNDSDVIIVPKSPILVADDIINLVFTRGIYGIAPYSVSTSFSFFNQLPGGR